MTEPSPVGAPYVIGLDIGTSSVKAVAFALDGRRVRGGSSPYETIREASGGVRQRAASWWAATLEALPMAVVPDGECLGIAVSGQIGTYLAVDASMAPVEDAWTWQDGRPASVLALLRESLDLDAVASDLRTWLPLGASWPLPRLLWLREERPDVLARVSFLLMPKDYLIHRLTGAVVTDPSSWRGLVTPEGVMHDAALRALGLPDVVAPRRPATAAAGDLLPDVAAHMGLHAPVPVFLGSNDFACALLGTGVIAEGDCFDIGGTSEHLGTLSVARGAGAGLVVVPFPPASAANSYVSYGVTSNGGSMTEWLASLLLPHVEPAERGPALSALVEDAVPGKRPLTFIPYLTGERSPIWNAEASGAWIGLRAEHDAGDLARAAFEGAAFNLRHIRESSSLSRPGQLVRASGGTARSSVWNRIKASVLGSPIAVMADLDSTALGAGIYAAIGAAAYGSPRDAAAAMTRIAHVVDPVPADAERYSQHYEHYRSLAGALLDHTDNTARSQP